MEDCMTFYSRSLSIAFNFEKIALILSTLSVVQALLLRTLL